MITDLTVAKETWIFLYSILLGGVLSAAYDILRVLRLEFKHRPAAVSAEDILYFLVGAFISFGFILKTNSGDVRMFILLGELIGWTLWHFTVGQLMVHICAAVFTAVKRVVRFFARLIFRPLILIAKAIFGVIKRLTEPIWRNVQSFSKKVVQKEKYNLKDKQRMLYNLFSRFIRTRQKGGDRDGTASDRTEHCKKKKKTSSANRLLVIAMAVFVGICSLKIVGTQIKISEKEYQLKQLEQSIEEQQKKNQDLENQLEKGKTDQTDAIGKTAFEQYGYGYPDEFIYIDSKAR